MPKSQPLHKLALSSLIVFSFAAYVLHERSVTTQEVTLMPSRGLRPHDVSNDNGIGANIFPPPIRQASAIPFASPRSTPPPASPTLVINVAYHDGTFTGKVTDAVYGNVQIKVVIQDGKITDVQFLDYPQDRRISQEINAQAMPMLKQEVIQAQYAQVNYITGATLTSQAFVQSLQSALDEAKK